MIRLDKHNLDLHLFKIQNLFKYKSFATKWGKMCTIIAEKDKRAWKKEGRRKHAAYKVLKQRTWQQVRQQIAQHWLAGLTERGLMVPRNSQSEGSWEFLLHAECWFETPIPELLLLSFWLPLYGKGRISPNWHRLRRTTICYKTLDGLSHWLQSRAISFPLRKKNNRSTFLSRFYKIFLFFSIYSPHSLSLPPLQSSSPTSVA